MDNSTALNYINKLGGTASPQLNHLTKELWLWYLEREITLQATHIVGKLNVITDDESRLMKDRTDWKLCPLIFKKINQLFDPLQVDLFASHLTNQISTYASWRPDPNAIAVNAFTLNLAEFQGCANPPWNLIYRQSPNTNQNTPGGANSHSTCLESPTLVPHTSEHVSTQTTPTSPQPNMIQPTHKVNQLDIIPILTMWPISGIDSESKTFQRKLRLSSSHHEETKRQSHTTHYSVNGLAGVVKGVPIPFREI